MFRIVVFVPVIACLWVSLVSAQGTNVARSLVDEGVALNDSGKYAEAAEKYTEALKINLNDLRADYEMGFTLYNEGKALYAIPFLEKILKSGESKYEAYDLLGSIYDDNKQPEKAIECYKNGIKDNPAYERLHFNLGISYLRQGKYPEAAACETDAIKLDPKNASSQRIYAIAEFDQGKRIQSLLAWCSFLLLEPQTQRSVEGCKYIAAILNYGIAKKDEKHINISLSGNDLGMGTMAMQIAVVSATEDKKNLSPLDSLTLELTSVFNIAGENQEIQKDQFCNNFFAKFFGQLAGSGNMSAFVHLITLSVYKDENIAWFKEYGKELDDLDLWLRSTQRDF